MKIKYKINLFFTSLVSFIFFLLFIIIFYSFSLTRDLEFRKRLKNRALTTINLLLNVSGIDRDILEKIDETTFIALQNKTETIYDLEGNVVFHFSDNKLPPEHLNSEYFKEIIKKEELFSRNNKKNTIYNFTQFSPN